MTTRVRLSQQVEEFLDLLAPEPRRALRLALRGLAADRGDIKQLEGNLSAFWRLRVGRMRVVYTVKALKGDRVVLCIFAGYRSTVYELVGQLLASGLLEELGGE